MIICEQVSDSLDTMFVLSIMGFGDKMLAAENYPNSVLLVFKVLVGLSETGTSLMLKVKE